VTRTVVLLILALATPVLATTTRCLTYEEKGLGRLYTVCSDGTRAVSTCSKTLGHWETMVT
jgi:hypothetical protein